MQKKAEERRAEGLTDLSDYVFNHPERVIWELIDKSWKMASASTIILRQKKDRIDILNEYRKKGSVCGGEWIEAAKQLLELNKIPVGEFTTAIYRNLRCGRGKYRNNDCGEKKLWQVIHFETFECDLP